MHKIHYFVSEKYEEGTQKGKFKGNKNLTDHISSESLVN